MDTSQYTPNDIARFWSKVDRRSDSECWNWTRNRTRFGYGLIRWDGKQTLAHRIAYLLSNGTIRRDLAVLHSCDNPSCCNPRHLSQGTVGDNNRDRAAKGRSARLYGSKNGNAKIDAITRSMVFALRAAKLTQREIAGIVGVTQQQVSNILRKKQRLLR